MHKEVLEWKSTRRLGKMGDKEGKKKNSLRKTDWVAGDPKQPLTFKGIKHDTKTVQDT